MNGATMTTPEPHPFTPDNTSAVVCVHGLRYDGKAWRFCGRTAEDAAHATGVHPFVGGKGRDRVECVTCDGPEDDPIHAVTPCGRTAHGLTCVFPAGHQGPWCDNGSACWLTDDSPQDDDLRVARAALATAHADRDRWKAEAEASRRQINEAHAHLEAAGAKTIRHVIRQPDRADDEVVRLTGALAAQTERTEKAEADATEWRNGFARAAWEASLDACAHCRKRADDATRAAADAHRETVAVREELARVKADRRDRLNADCQAIGDQLDRIKATAYRQALADAATCHVRAAGKWAAEPITHPGRTLNLYAYVEGARVLTAWADDPTRMDGPLRGAGRATDAPSPPSPPGPCCEAPTPARVAGIPFAPCLRCGEPCTEAEPEPPPEATVIAQFLAGLGMVSSLPGLNLGRASDLLGMLHDAGLIVTAEADGSEDPASHALRAAADEWDRLNAGPDFTEIEALVRDHYRPGLSLPSIWLRLRAGAIEVGA